jgi:hypothetical protein
VGFRKWQQRVQLLALVGYRLILMTDLHLMAKMNTAMKPITTYPHRLSEFGKQLNSLVEGQEDKASIWVTPALFE